jgi:ferrous iron transport protein B
MRAAVAPLHFQRRGALLALVGNPNAGKTALFNRLTGARQKVANYAGVTVERVEGALSLPSGRQVRVLDLPGAYALNPRSPDERITADVLYGRAAGERRPDVVVCVVDASNLRRHLRLVLAVKRLGLPLVVALNMVDRAAARGRAVDAARLARLLGVPVVPTVATRGEGVAALCAALDDGALWDAPVVPASPAEAVVPDLRGDHLAVQHILEQLGLDTLMPETPSDRIDRIALHPIAGPAILALVLFLVFQAVFAWAEGPMSLIEAGTAALAEAVRGNVPEGLLQSLLADGVVAGLGGVIVFLPQIVILFFFILVLEESGYLPRGAFLLDRVMGQVGLSGRAFIPLLSSFACAIPGIMAARTIPHTRDRWVTIMVAPLMTCSARLPVYTLLIGAFIPPRDFGFGIGLKGLVLFGLYLSGILGGLAVAWCLHRFTSVRAPRTLMMELPAYHWPSAWSILLGLWQRVQIFLARVGGVILALTILLWFLASFPAPPADAVGPAIEHSFAGMLGRALAVLFAPIGFNWQISVALVPGMAAREVVVSALATVYALQVTDEDAAHALQPILAADWSLATALSLLAWFVFAPQCLSTLATVRRETGGWMGPAVMAAYLFVLAYLAAFLTYRSALALGGGG